MRVSAYIFHYKRKSLQFRMSKTKGVKSPKPPFKFSTSNFQQNGLVAKYQQHKTRQKFTILVSISMYWLVKIWTFNPVPLPWYPLSVWTNFCNKFSTKLSHIVFYCQLLTSETRINALPCDIIKRCVPLYNPSWWEMVG